MLYNRLPQLNYTTQPYTNHNCTCCAQCKLRINHLEVIINQLFCYMSDFLPNQLEGITQTPHEQETSNHQSHINQGHPMDSTTRNRKYRPRIKKPFNDSILIKKPIQPLNLELQQKPGKARKQYGWQQKKKLVSQVEQRILIGQRIVDACRRSGISDRSYQRWKRRIQEGQLQDFECESDEVIIQHSHI